MEKIIKLLLVLSICCSLFAYNTNSNTVYANDDTVTASTLKEETNEVDIEFKDTKSLSIPFTDVKDGDWYKNYVNEAYQLGLMTGATDTEFRPLKNMNRGMVAIVLHRMEGAEETEFEQLFKDVDGSADEYYAEAVTWAKKNGVINGYEHDGTFKPLREISREEMAQMLYNFAIYKGVDVTAEADLSKFEDGDKVKDYHIDAMKWANANGLITGKYNGTKLDSQGTATRAECCKMLVEAYKIIYNLSSTCIVSFNTNGGSIIESQTVTRGTTVIYPELPEKEGFAFAGWFIDKNEINLEKQFDFSTSITYDITLYAKWIDLSNDFDGDGLPYDMEIHFGSNPHLKDTDDDGLNDYDECVVLGTNPLDIDTDDNNTFDSDEDLDGDALTNKYELDNGLNPICKDSDYEGLEDNLELQVGTNPLIVDTDNDGVTDYEEYIEGTNPVVAENSKEVIEKIYQTEDLGIHGACLKPIINISASRENLRSLEVKPVSNIYISSSVPGYIGEAYDFSMNGTFESAVISFEFDKELLQNEGFNPTIYYFNETTKEFEEMITTVSGNVATAILEHFSIYVLLNKTEFDKVWETEIEPPLLEGETDNNSLDVVFVIDYSHSMVDNDPEGIRKDVTKKFIEKLRTESDQASIIKFIKTCNVLTDLTYDKKLLIDLVDNIQDDSGKSNESGTNGTRALANALKVMENSDANNKYIVFLTDGEDTYYSYYNSEGVEKTVRSSNATKLKQRYEELANEAKEKGFVVYTIGLGTEVDDSNLLMISEITGGKYYKATISEDLNDIYEKIESETIDYVTDSNNDGISDYYTQLCVDGILRTSTGKRVFGAYSFEEIQSNDDLDGDGLKNGEEAIVKLSSDNTVRVYLNSSPALDNSDYDKYNDYKEIKIYNTDPLKYNYFIDEEDILFTKNNEQFISEKYRTVYEENWGEQLTVWLGTGIFSTEYQYTMIYKEQFVDFFKSIDNENIKHQGLDAELCYDLIDQFKALAEEIADKYMSNSETVSNINSKIKELYTKIDSVENALIKLEYTNGSYTDDFYNLVDDLMEYRRELIDNLDKLENKSIIAKIEKFGEISESLDYVFITIDTLVDAKENRDAIIEMLNQLDTMVRNIYVFDCVIDSNVDEKIKAAAVELRNLALADISEFETALNNEISKYENKFLFSVLGRFAHLCIGESSIYGKVFEAAISIYDFCCNISGYAKEAIKCYGMSTVSSILNEKTVLNTYEEDCLSKFLTMVVSRVESENQMIDTIEVNTWITQWAFENYYEIESIKENITTLDNLKSKYCF